MAQQNKPKAPPVSLPQAFVAMKGQLTKTTVEDVFNYASDEDRAKRGSKDTGSVEHTTADKVTMWKPLENGDWMPREVPVTHIEMNLKAGWAVQCPMCNTTDCSSDPNSCAGRPKRMLRRCPECRKRVYDEARGTPDVDPEDEDAEERDPNEIADSAYANSTPETRTKARLDRHMLAYHPEQAAAYGLVAQNPRDPTNNQRS